MGQQEQREPSAFTRALFAGALAGTTVDLSLYPIDTLKTRLQSSRGFTASGGFSGIYKGVGSAFVGSAPGAALFFVSYEATKSFFAARGEASEVKSTQQDEGRSYLRESGVHMIAASVGEVAACAVRVPTEVVKQRAQASQHPSSLDALLYILRLRRSKGFGTMYRELYRGWAITVFREVPFTCIQFPLWEALKKWRCEQRGTQQSTAAESAIFGMVAGAVAAGATTPLDVLKTRMMLATGKVSLNEVARGVLNDGGVLGLFAGLGPRVGWISVGGAVFLGSYQWAWNQLSKVI